MPALALLPVAAVEVERHASLYNRIARYCPQKNAASG
jgi:hypothetical protein